MVPTVRVFPKQQDFSDGLKAETTNQKNKLGTTEPFDLFKII